MSGELPRLLGVDFGEARIGLAGTDDLGLMVHPLETVPSQPRDAALERIATVAKQRRVQRIVIGLPVRADGTEGPAAAKVRKFTAALRPLLPAEIEFAFQDEYGSTVQAQESLRSAGRTSRDFRQVIDQAAAAAILEDYIRSVRPTLLPEDDEDFF